MEIVIPAAGLGTRFLPRFPKEALMLGDRPLLAHALSEAADVGFKRAVIVLSPAKAELESLLPEWADGRIDVRVAYQPTAAGPGDAVLAALEFVESTTFGVLYPDDVVLARDHWTRLLSANQTAGAAALCVRQVPPSEVGRFGVAVCVQAESELRVVDLVEKPVPSSIDSDLAIFGRYVVTTDVVDGLRRGTAGGELQLTDGFAAALNGSGGVAAVMFEGEIFDCGTPEEYARSAERFRAEVELQR